MFAELLDVFLVGDDAQAKAGVEAFVESLGLRLRAVQGHWEFALGVGEFPG